MKTFLCAIALFLFSLTALSQPTHVRTGIHSLTIQWISFNNVNPGTVLIKSIGNSQYSIEGEQRDKLHNEYLTVKGTFRAADRKLYFDGTIISRIASINNGEPCERKGEAVFKASGKRKYWRLQQMLNCDKETTDYIDIFF